MSILRNLVMIFIGLLPALSGVSRTYASPVDIRGYDIYNGLHMGVTGWTSWYSGNTYQPGNNNWILNYVGGTGTLADGDVPTSPNSGQVFYLPSSNPTIIFYLNQPIRLASISLLGSYAGIIGGLDVTVNDITQSYTPASSERTAPVNGWPSGYTGRPADYVVTLSDQQTSQDALSFTLSRFQVTQDSCCFISIGEVEAAPVPEPLSFSLVLIGLVILCMMSIRKHGFT